MRHGALVGLFLLAGTSCALGLGPLPNSMPQGYYEAQAQASNTSANQAAQAAQTLFQNVDYTKIAADAHVSTQEVETPNLYGQADDNSHRLMIKSDDTDSRDADE